jgi:hypothetical protein
VEPTALVKAQSLNRFATEQGSPLSTFQLTISDDEGLELLDYLVEQSPPNELLSEDVALAHKTHDPWPVLTHFTLLGLQIAPLQVLN